MDGAILADPETPNPAKFLVSTPVIKDGAGASFFDRRVTSGV